MKRSSLCRKLKGQRNPVRTHHQVFGTSISVHVIKKKKKEKKNYFYSSTIPIPLHIQFNSARTITKNR